MPRDRTPSYRLHKRSGQAIVTIAGKDHYLGRHGTPESHSRYRKLIADLESGIPADAKGVTIASLCVAYKEFAAAYYIKDGLPTSSETRARKVCRDLVIYAGHEHPDRFRPIDLGHMRDGWAKDGRCRMTVGLYMSKIRDIFRFGVERGMVSPSTWHGLLAVANLKRGRSGAIDYPPVLPVPQGDIEAVIAIATPEVAAMIRLQLLTGMRPGEVAGMRADAVDRAATVWIYRPTRHKTQHKGKDRSIAIGVKGRLILTPWIERAAGGLVFPPSPDRAAMTRRASSSDQEWLSQSYGEAIKRYCKAAGVAHWTPNQLRHNAATAIRRSHGLIAASEILGHSSTQTTLVYAERDMDSIIRTAEEFG